QDYFNDPLKNLFGTPKIFSGVFDGSKGMEMVDGVERGGVTSSSKPGGLSRVHLLAKKLDDWLKPFEGDVSEVKTFPDRVQFAITAEALFSPGEILLKPDAQPVLDRIASVLKNIDAYVMIEAHTDD